MCLVFLSNEKEIQLTLFKQTKTGNDAEIYSQKGGSDQTCLVGRERGLDDFFFVCFCNGVRKLLEGFKQDICLIY